ncbi:uncharacterized protein PADG_11578 [Paracoccidioides brasiliensis Pb18]|uniref:LysM domain-containing protein n=1 Tax=Paracoccidioides brasiliensis (strain Pb18) TaxID=502780 RepID=A0A0A0HT53_PARBD|nr:uncharacterized protein PADG_11578 [Paracoccidioides brasiliensis Pb18]KGM92379.1 hypothetical protein PADG_11578 [Paracoccidioides brasiliensis Pb18]
MNLQAALCILAVLCVNGLPTGTLSFSQNPNSTCLETHTAARLGDICASIKPGQNYCNEIAVQGQSAVPETVLRQATEFMAICARQWLVGPNDTCESIATVAGISVGELVTLNVARNPRKLRKHQPECVGLSGILFLSIHGGRQIYKLRSPYSTRKRRKLRQKLGHVFLTPRKSP